MIWYWADSSAGVPRGYEDSLILQADLELLSQWATVWQMKFNVSKCIVIRCSRSLAAVQCGYRLNNITLSTDDQHTYLGILLHKSLSWSGHIASIASKASQIFNFLRRNLSKCSSTVKASSYLTLVHPIMQPQFGIHAIIMISLP